MIKPRNDIADRVDRVACRFQWALEHQNSNAKFARCGEFAVSRLPATILRDEHINPVMQQQRAFGRLVERPAGLNIIGRGQSQRRLHWIHTSDQVVMLRGQLKRGNLLSADGKKYPEGFRSQCLRRRARIGNFRPAVRGHSPPRRAAQDNKRRASLAGRCHGVSRHRRGIWVCGINQRADLVVSQILRKPSDPAKPTRAQRNRLRSRHCGATRQRNSHCEIRAVGKFLRKFARLGRAAENQDVSFHGAR